MSEMGLKMERQVRSAHTHAHKSVYSRHKSSHIGNPFQFVVHDFVLHSFSYRFLTKSTCIHVFGDDQNNPRKM